jgi:hypothetical protein
MTAAAFFSAALLCGRENSLQKNIDLFIDLSTVLGDN